MCDSMNHTRIPWEVLRTAHSKSGQTRYKRVMVYNIYINTLTYYDRIHPPRWPYYSTFVFEESRVQILVRRLAVQFSNFNIISQPVPVNVGTLPHVSESFPLLHFNVSIVNLLNLAVPFCTWGNSTLCSWRAFMFFYVSQRKNTAALCLFSDWFSWINACSLKGTDLIFK